MLSPRVSKFRLIFTFLIPIVALVLGSEIRHRTRTGNLHYQRLSTLELTHLAIGRYVIGFPTGAIITDWYQAVLDMGDSAVGGAQSQVQEKLVAQKSAKEPIETFNLGNSTRLDKPRSFSFLNEYVLAQRDDRYRYQQIIISENEYLLLNNPHHFTDESVPFDPAMSVSKYCTQGKPFLVLRRRCPREIPTEPGTCFEGSILLDGPGRKVNDHISASIRWPDRPDVHFHFTIFGNGPKPDPPLLTRLKEHNAIPVFGVLRSGPRTIDENAGEEHLERVTGNNGTVSHLFKWEAQGLPRRFDRPQLVLRMTTGNAQGAPIHSSFSSDFRGRPRPNVTV